MASREGIDFVCRVLVVDDCPAMRELMRASLERLGHSVEAVGDGDAALDAVHKTSFDVVVLDVEMPGPDGMAVGRALRRIERTAEVIIAMHSSVAESVVRAGFKEYDAYVPKSADVRLLGDLVDRLVRSRRMVTRPSLSSVDMDTGHCCPQAAGA